MNAEDTKFKVQWEKTRSKGRIMYGLRNGSVFGFVMFLLINLFELKEHSFRETFLSQHAIYQMVYMVIAGIIGYSTIKWWMNENIHKKIIGKT